MDSLSKFKHCRKIITIHESDIVFDKISIAHKYRFAGDEKKNVEHLKAYGLRNIKILLIIKYVPKLLNIIGTFSWE